MMRLGKTDISLSACPIKPAGRQIQQRPAGLRRIRSFTHI